MSVESKNDFFVAGNTYYLGDYKNAEKNQVLFYGVSDNKFIFNNSADFSFSPEVYYLENLKLKDEDKAYFQPKTLSLNYYGKKLSLKVGYYEMKKEGPDIFDPLDYQQPKNYMDPLHVGNLSLLGLKAEYEATSWLSFEGAYISRNRVPVLPTRGSPWYPRENQLPFSSNTFSAKLPPDALYDISENRARQDSDLEHNFIIKTKITTANADIILQAAEILSNTPDITPVLVGDLVSTQPVFSVNLDNPVQLHVVWKKVKDYGGGITVPIDSLKILTKLFVNEEVADDKKTTLGTFAVERTFDSLTVVLEVTKETVTSAQDTSDLSTITNLYENAVALGFRYAPTDHFSLLIGGIYDAVKGSYVGTFKPKYFFTNNLYSELQVIAVGGRPGSLLSYFDKNDSASLAIGTTF